MTSRKKPGVAFWATVVLSLPVPYVGSFVMFVVNDGLLSGPPREFLRLIYFPLIWLAGRMLWDSA